MLPDNFRSSAPEHCARVNDMIPELLILGGTLPRYLNLSEAVLKQKEAVSGGQTWR